MALPSRATTAEMLDACSGYMAQLESAGVTVDVAVDRTWDAYVVAWLDMDVHCCDPRDRLFENKLRTIRKRGQHA